MFRRKDFGVWSEKARDLNFGFCEWCDLRLFNFFNKNGLIMGMGRGACREGIFRC